MSIISLENLLGDNGEFTQYRNENPECPLRHPTRCCLIGGSGSGKTTVLANLILNPKLRMTYDKIHIFAKYIDCDDYRNIISHLEDIQDEMSERIYEKSMAQWEKKGKNAGQPQPRKVQYKILEHATSSLDDLPPLDSLDADCQHLVIFDDFVFSSADDRIRQYFIASRKKNCSVFFLSQKLTSVRLNSSVFCYFGTPSGTEVSILHRDSACLLDKDAFTSLFRKVTSKPHGFLCIYANQPADMTYRDGFDEFIPTSKVPEIAQQIASMEKKRIMKK